MTRKGWSLSALSTELGVDRRTVGRRLSDASVRPIGQRAGAAVYDLRQAAEAVLRVARPAQQGVEEAAAATRGIFAQQRIPDAALVPWLHDEIVTLPEYEERIGIEGDEVLDLIAFGLPLLPPARGSDLARVSIPHADRWRWLFGLLVTARGGDGDSPHVAGEVRRLLANCPAEV